MAPAPRVDRGLLRRRPARVRPGVPGDTGARYRRVAGSAGRGTADDVVDVAATRYRPGAPPPDGAARLARRGRRVRPGRRARVPGVLRPERPRRVLPRPAGRAD